MSGLFFIPPGFYFQGIGDKLKVTASALQNLPQCSVSIVSLAKLENFAFSPEIENYSNFIGQS